jgi:hypothetical protein
MAGRLEPLSEPFHPPRNAPTLLFLSAGSPPLAVPGGASCGRGHRVCGACRAYWLFAPSIEWDELAKVITGPSFADCPGKNAAPCRERARQWSADHMIINIPADRRFSLPPRLDFDRSTSRRGNRSRAPPSTALLDIAVPIKSVPAAWPEGFGNPEHAAGCTKTLGTRGPSREA